MKTVVSITPVRVAADSRTLKQAASFARFGFRSIVVEGQPSDFPGNDLPFDLRTLPQPASGGGSASNSETDLANHIQSRSDRRLMQRMRRRLKSSPLGPPLQFALRMRRRLNSTPLGPPLQFARFLADYCYRYCWLPLRYIPAASLYYMHAPDYFPAIYLLCLRHQARFIYDAHDFYSGMRDRREMRSNLDWWCNRFRRLVEILCIRKAAAVTTVSDGIAAWQREEFGRSPIVLRNVHDCRLDRATEPGLRELLGLAPRTFLLVTVGQAKPGQVVREALIAVAMLPETIHLAFVGRYYDKYLDLMRELGIEGRVHLVAPVKPYEVVPFIRSADASLILYYPHTRNYVNCLPNGFFQSVAAELPLLYPELPEIKKLAEQYELGISIDPQQSESIRTAVEELSGNPKRVQAYRQNLQRAKQELSWEREEVVLRELLTEVLDRP
jgi:glycosyltransferase involved in cell wall biosynthesis